MRLIDADYLIEYIESDDNVSITAREFENQYIECIMDVPTAFDIEKILEKIAVRQLSITENLRNATDEGYSEMLRGQLRGIADCLEILNEMKER